MCIDRAAQFVASFATDLSGKHRIGTIIYAVPSHACIQILLRLVRALVTGLAIEFRLYVESLNLVIDGLVTLRALDIALGDVHLVHEGDVDPLLDVLDFVVAIEAS